MPPPGAASSSSGASEPAFGLRVATLNVGMTSGLVSVNHRELLGNADVMFLQELGAWDAGVPQDRPT